MSAAWMDWIVLLAACLPPSLPFVVLTLALCFVTFIRAHMLEEKAQKTQHDQQKTSSLQKQMKKGAFGVKKTTKDGLLNPRAIGGGRGGRGRGRNARR